MRRKIRFRGKRTRTGVSGYLRGGTKYIWGRTRITWKKFF